jgi:hypothetical protein
LYEEEVIIKYLQNIFHSFIIPFQKLKRGQFLIKTNNLPIFHVVLFRLKETLDIFLSNFKDQIKFRFTLLRK